LKILGVKVGAEERRRKEFHNSEASSGGTNDCPGRVGGGERGQTPEPYSAQVEGGENCTVQRGNLKWGYSTR